MPAPGGVCSVDIVIENIVAYAQLADSLDLEALAKGTPDAEYEPEKFPALVLRYPDPPRSILLFRSGKAVCTGVKDPAKLAGEFGALGKRLRELGAKVGKDVEVSIQNIVATTQLGKDINLNAVALSLGLDRVEYNPDKFPGLVFHLDNPQLVTILFGSGKIVCSGGRTVEAVQDGMAQVERELRTAELAA
jgi:transcription initiation factor TFIID TATA-box-binding protein